MRWPWFALPAGIVVTVIWPLQVLGVAMLATSALMLLSVYATFTDHGVVPQRVRDRLERPLLGRVGVLTGAIGVLLAVGVVATLLWPATLAPVAFGLLVIMCAAWLLTEGVLRRREHARAGDGDQPADDSQ